MRMAGSPVFVRPGQRARRRRTAKVVVNKRIGTRRVLLVVTSRRVRPRRTAVAWAALGVAAVVVAGPARTALSGRRMVAGAEDAGSGDHDRHEPGNQAERRRQG
jgi:hypothetical protein